ncbi:MAG TPA: phage tail tape measure protein, partial [Burkholderiales bacterium]|nr:phage tail tape measure protein [Burkholderiales bacterium]
LSSQFSQSQLKVKELALAIKNTANPTKKLTNDFERAQIATSTLNNKLKTKRNELNEVRKALEKAGISTTNLTTHEKSLALETDKLTNKEQKFSSVLAKRAELQQKADNWKGKVFSTIALGGIAIAPIMLAAKAQEASAEFKTSMMDATGKVSPEFAKLNALAAKFGRSLPLTTAEYRSMFLELKKGGIETESILNGVGRATAYLATVTHISTDDAAKYASNLIKATGASTKEAMSLIDIMQRLEDVKVAPAEIAEAFQKLSGVLRTTNNQGVAGVKAYAPLIAMFTRQGMNGGDAGQTISKIINASMLIRQSTLNAIQSMYGLQFKFTNKNGNFAGIESFMQQLEKIKTLNARGQADVIKNLFGGKPAILAVVTQLM